MLWLCWVSWPAASYINPAPTLGRARLHQFAHNGGAAAAPGRGSCVQQECCSGGGGGRASLQIWRTDNDFFFSCLTNNSSCPSTIRRFFACTIYSRQSDMTKCYQPPHRDDRLATRARKAWRPAPHFGDMFEIYICTPSLAVYMYLRQGARWRQSDGWMLRAITLKYETIARRDPDGSMFCRARTPHDSIGCLRWCSNVFVGYSKDVWFIFLWLSNLIELVEICWLSYKDI